MLWGGGGPGSMCEALLLFMSAFVPDAVFEGVILAAPHQPLWVWRRRETSPSSALSSSSTLYNNPSACLQLLQYYYPELHCRLMRKPEKNLCNRTKKGRREYVSLIIYTLLLSPRPLSCSAPPRPASTSLSSSLASSSS